MIAAAARSASSSTREASARVNGVHHGPRVMRLRTALEAVEKDNDRCMMLGVGGRLRYRFCIQPIKVPEVAVGRVDALAAIADRRSCEHKRIDRLRVAAGEPSRCAIGRGGCVHACGVLDRLSCPRSRAMDSNGAPGGNDIFISISSAPATRESGTAATAIRTGLRVAQPQSSMADRFGEHRQHFDGGIPADARVGNR